MILAIDYGRRRMGLALSDETELIATAIDHIIVKDFNDSVLKALFIIKKLNAEKIVIGLPLGDDNKPTKMSIEIEEFAQKIKDNGKIEIIFWNEVGTSKLAKNNSNNRKGIDSNSARIILQEYLDHSH